MKQLLLIILVLLAVAIAAGWILLRRFEKNKLYEPAAKISITPADFQLRFQDVQFIAEDGTSLTGWWVPANRPRGTIVYCHGNTGNVGNSAHFAPEFYKRGFNLLLWDYRGYGRSAGRPSENGLYQDARAAFDAAEAMSGKLPILIYGNSLGGAVAIQLATDRSAAALIVEGSFSSAADMARRWYPDFPVDRILSVSFDSASKAATLSGLPKLFGHSPNDDVIPFQSGRILHASAAAPKTFVLLSGDHNENSWFTPAAAGHAEFEAFLGQFKR